MLYAVFEWNCVFSLFGRTHSQLQHNTFPHMPNVSISFSTLNYFFFLSMKKIKTFSVLFCFYFARACLSRWLRDRGEFVPALSSRLSSPLIIFRSLSRYIYKASNRNLFQIIHYSINWIGSRALQPIVLETDNI